MAPRRKSLTPEIAFEEIGPDEAMAFMAENTNNRNIRRNRVSQYARDIRAGRWQPIGEPVMFDPTGRLINGQHRMLAILEANMAITIPVIRNIDPRAQDVSDRGLQRSFPDVLKLHYDERSVTVLSAAVRQVRQYRDTGTMGQTGGHDPSTMPTIPELMNTFERERRLVDSVPVMQHARRDGGIWFAPGILVASHYIFSEIDPDEADAFFERFTTGAGLERGNPILALRRIAIRRPMDFQPKSQAAILIKAFNFWRAGRHVLAGNLRWRGGGKNAERFPRILLPEEIAEGKSEALIEEEATAE